MDYVGYIPIYIAYTLIYSVYTHIQHKHSYTAYINIQPYIHIPSYRCQPGS